MWPSVLSMEHVVALGVLQNESAKPSEDALLPSGLSPLWLAAGRSVVGAQGSAFGSSALQSHLGFCSPAKGALFLSPRSVAGVMHCK